MEWCKFLWGNPCTAIEESYHLGFCLWDFGFSMHFSHSAAQKISQKDSAVSILHAYPYRVGNCNCLLWNTARWLSIANNLLEFFVHAVVSPDSWPRRSFHNFCFWPQKFFVRKFCSILLFQHCLHSVIIRSSFLLMNLHVVQFQYGLEFSQTLVFLICTSFPKRHQVGFSS